MPKLSIEGVWTALVTPFKQNGSIDWTSFETLLHAQQDAGISGIVLCGTTGESPTLSIQEKMSLIRKARSVLDSTMQIMTGVGSSHTEQTVEFTKLAIDCGTNALLVVTPPYNKPSLNGLLGHFEKISEATTAQVPICLYHVPGRTGQFLSVDAVKRICEISNVTSVKEASGDIAFLTRCVHATNGSKKITYLSGDDPTYLASLAVGSKGVISVASNVYPREMVKLTQLFLSGQVEKACALNLKLLSLIDVLFCESNPGPTKAALLIKGQIKNSLRLPLAPVTEQNFKLMEKVLRDTDELLKSV